MPHGIPSYQLVVADGQKPERWLLFLHGILGRGNNWRSLARRILDGRRGLTPQWGAVLVDLRAHGTSQGLPGPDTVEQAAADLERLPLPGPVGGVLGHSFGGKVALAALARRPVAETWVIDANPGPVVLAHSTTATVVGTLRALGPGFASRAGFVAAVAAAGFGEDLAQWLATNLVRDGGAYRFALDLDAIEALLDDYARRDLWSVVERPPTRSQLHVVIGRRSGTFTDGDRERLARSPAIVDELDAGHWVHVDDPDGLVRLLTQRQEIERAT